MESFFSVLEIILYNILIPVLILSFLIFIHELGHYLAARIFKVAIKEFAIGMGPKIFSFRKNKIDYAIRAIPMGGALTMHGEDEESEVENAVSKKPVWQRFIIISAGSFMNLLLGFILMAVIVTGLARFPSTTIKEFVFTEEGGPPQSNKDDRLPNERLYEGDVIISINGKTISVYNDLVYALIREGSEPLDIIVMRGDEKKELTNVKFPVATEDGITYGVIDFIPKFEEKTFPMIIKQTFFQSLSTIDMVWTSFFDLITGKYGMEEISGPVGVTQVIGNSAKDVTVDRANSRGFLFLIALITMNLGVVNLLPLPALDGGRIIFLIIELVRRKPIKPEYEGYVHLVGFAVLILFMIFVTYKDVMKLIVG